MAGPFALFFVPKSSGGGAGGQAAKDALGNDVKESEWVKTHKPGDRSLAQGLKGDATYLVVTDENKIEKYGINAVCTHLGCVVPWVGFIKVAIYKKWFNSPFEMFGCLGPCVSLCVLLVFGSCLGFLVWAHGFRMSDGWGFALGWVCQSCV